MFALPISDYGSLSPQERSYIFAGTSVNDSAPALKAIREGGGMMVPFGNNSEVTQFFSFYLLTLMADKTNNFPVTLALQYPHRSGDNVSRWGLAFTGKVTPAKKIAQGRCSDGGVPQAEPVQPQG